MGAYGGGQYELGVGRGHVQLLAALFHPHAPNDIAPGGYDALDPGARAAREPARRRPGATRVPARHRLGRPCRPSPAKSASSRSPRWLRCSSSRPAPTRSWRRRPASRPPRRPSSAPARPSAWTPSKAREHFRAAIAAARPQERLQLRRMAEASIALAERRAGDLKVATEKLGGTPPTNRQLLMLRRDGRDRAAAERRPPAPDRRRPARDRWRSSLVIIARLRRSSR